MKPLLYALTFLTAAALSPLAASAQASFDCNRAGTPVEHAICADSTLSQLDRQMAARYGAARSAASAAGRDRLLAEQRNWLARRNSCGSDRACLAQHMQARIAQLSGGGTTSGGNGSGGAGSGGLTGLYCTSNGIMGVEDRGDTLRFDILVFGANGHSCGTDVQTARRQGGAWVAVENGCELRVTREGSEIVLRSPTVAACKDLYCGARAVLDEVHIPLSSRQPGITDPFIGGVGERPC